MKRWLEGLLDFLFPRKCPFCGRVVETDGVCETCQKELPWLTEREAECYPEFVSMAASALRYQGKVKECVRRFKFQRQCGYAKVLGTLTAQCARDHFKVDFDLVTYPPLSPKGLKKRGYDQARLLAEEVGRELDLPVAGLFDKSNLAGQQSRLKTPSSRRANVLAVFTLKPGVELEGKTILLVDDVITSGATASECTRVLLLAGARRVYAVSPAKGGKIMGGM